MTGVQILMRVHYSFFMANPRFWYERDLREADAIIVKAASDLRLAEGSTGVRLGQANTPDSYNRPQERGIVRHRNGKAGL